MLLSKTKDFSPLTAYDNYWNTYFNWESQGYALREAYRGNAEYQVKRAYALIALYYNIGTGNTAVVYQKYGQLLNDSLTQIEQNGPGLSPQEVANNWVLDDYGSYNLKLENGLYTGTFNKRLYALYFNYGNYFGEETINGVNVSTGLVEKYVSKLHGRTLKDEMLLAGFIERQIYYEGVVFDVVKKSETKVKADLITWEGNLYTDATITQDYGEHEIQDRGLGGKDAKAIEVGVFYLK